jgi:hypothetical protein
MPKPTSREMTAVEWDALERSRQGFDKARRTPGGRWGFRLPSGEVLPAVYTSESAAVFWLKQGQRDRPGRFEGAVVVQVEDEHGRPVGDV